MKKQHLVHGGLDSLALTVDKDEILVEIGLKDYGGIKGGMYISRNQVKPLIKFLKKFSEKHDI